MKAFRVSIRKAAERCEVVAIGSVLSSEIIQLENNPLASKWHSPRPNAPNTTKQTERSS
jgi:hypothetical protein